MAEMLAHAETAPMGGRALHRAFTDASSERGYAIDAIVKILEGMKP